MDGVLATDDSDSDYSATFNTAVKGFCWWASCV